MINQEISNIFNNMAAYCEMSEDKNAFFRARAFQKAAEIVGRFPHDFANPEWHSDINKLKKIEGVGERIAKHIKEYAETGVITEYEQMKQASPVNLEELLRIQGVGPKTILKLHKILGVTNIETLKTAAETGQISQLEGFGPKKEQNILESIDFAIVNKDRISIALAEETVKKLTNHLNTDKDIEQFEFSGSYRRKAETVGDLDILVTSKDPKSTISHFVNYTGTEKILGQGDTKASIWLKTKIQVDVRVVDKSSFGAALQYFTGNVDHNVKLRNIAISKQYKLSEYGLFKRDTNEIIESQSEEKIYEKLGLQYIVPELREDLGEVESAKSNSLPNLIKTEDIKGDLQMHTEHSDGSNTIEDMAIKALSLGYEYIGITDHFGKLHVANAISEDEFDDYLSAIRKTDQKMDNIKIYASGEVEIDKDGNLEFDENKLKQLDYVIAAVHFSTKMDTKTMTNRIIKALKHPLLKILAHPTGRIIGQRPGFEFDYEEVFKVAREEGVALEVNAHPARLDLNFRHVKTAVDLGCKLIINTDSHSASEMDNMKFGVDTAKRGWLSTTNLATIENIINDL